MYWDFGNDGRIDHASVVVSIEDGDITYAQHTTDKIDGSLKDYLKGHPEARIYVVKIKDSAS